MSEIESLFPRRLPKPAADCDVCAALMKQWRVLTNPRLPAFDPSAAVDAAVEIKRHPHAGK
ncbi:hypothetical protein ABT084_32910 [Streptomyces sp. NPDC002138]|uniref:hypothetical protein n=1 Tax=Streptomyces sp. NPDC002138 TaxID=3154410 RepID=UPI00332D9DD0